MYKLNVATNKTGLSKILKVMAGDKLDILAKSYYTHSCSPVTNSPFNASSIINAFLAVAGGGNAAVQHGANGTDLGNNTNGTVNPLNTFSNSNYVNPYNNVKACSYIIFDSLSR